MATLLWVAIGGAIGAAARYGVNVWSGRLLGTSFPWHTLIVNVLGCLIMGMLVEVLARKVSVSLDARAFLTTGILGGFTTFSAFSLDFALLVERKAYVAAAGYGVASVVLSLGAVFVGLALGRSVLT